MSLFRSRVVALASWGAWFECLPKEMALSLRRVWHKISLSKASRPLFNLLAGHMFHAEFWAVVSSIGTMRQVQVPWRCVPKSGGWQSFISARMRELNWKHLGACCFQHDLGQIDLSNADQDIAYMIIRCVKAGVVCNFSFGRNRTEVTVITCQMNGMWSRMLPMLVECFLLRLMAIKEQWCLVLPIRLLVMIGCVAMKSARRVHTAASRSRPCGNTFVGIALLKAWVRVVLMSLTMISKLGLVGPHVAVMPMIDLCCNTLPGSGPWCLKTWIELILGCGVRHLRVFEASSLSTFYIYMITHGAGNTFTSRSRSRDYHDPQIQ